jgi:hypothetical protein
VRCLVFSKLLGFHGRKTTVTIENDIVRSNCKGDGVNLSQLYVPVVPLAIPTCYLLQSIKEVSQRVPIDQLTMSCRPDCLIKVFGTYRTKRLYTVWIFSSIRESLEFGDLLFPSLCVLFRHNVNALSALVSRWLKWLRIS